MVIEGECELEKITKRKPSKADRLSVFTLNVRMQTSMIDVQSVSEQVGECEPECNLHVLGSVWEVIGILRSRVLWAVRGRVTNDHHDGTVRKHPFGNSEEVDAVVGDEICEIILGKGGSTNTVIKVEREIFKTTQALIKFISITMADFSSSSDFQINRIGPAGI